MKGIKVKFYQKTASFKEPIMNGSILTTHPLPPYSTVIGMIHKLCQWEETHRIKLSLVCTNEYLMQPQQVFDKGYIGGFHFRTINKEMEDRWSIIVDDDAGDYFGFTTRLCTVELLVDRYYTLHICVEYENDFAQIFKAFNWLPVEYSPVEKIGSVWKIPTYYKIVRDKRRFEYIRCYLGERGALASYRLDEDNEQLILI